MPSFFRWTNSMKSIIFISALFDYMKKYSLQRIIIILFILSSTPIPGQKSISVDLNSIIPEDTSVIKITLENGFTYFIKRNGRPANRAVFRLVIKAGAVQENDNQNGLAHFIEHMAFNGTKNFEKNDLVEYFKSIGTKLGTDLNGGTGLDQTIYEFQVRSDDSEIFENAFLICSDWAQNISFLPDEVEKEKGVILEEWRLGRNASQRMSDKHARVIYKGSKYAERNVIGGKEIILSATRDKLLEYYNEWYRPDLMALIVVGDFNPDEAEKYIEKYFAKIPRNPKPIRDIPLNIPDHQGTKITVASDKEALNTYIEILYKKDISFQATIKDFRSSIVSNLFHNLFNKRFKELEQKEDTPFIYAYSFNDRLVRTKDSYKFMMGVKENQIIPALTALLTEAERVKRYGFTQAEFARGITEAQRFAEIRFSGKDYMNSSDIALNYVNNFLSGNLSPSEEDRYKFVLELLPTISLDEVNACADMFISKDNRVLTISMPQRYESEIPDESAILSLFDYVKNSIIDPYADEKASSLIFERDPQPGEIVDENYYGETEISELFLSNGARVILKPMNLNSEEIFFKAFSPGGASLIEERYFNYAPHIGEIIFNSGVGNLDRNSLSKFLSGKIASVKPFIGMFDEGMDGYTSPKDAEYLFQLIYAYFVYPRIDNQSLLAYKSKIKSDLENLSMSPFDIADDSLTAVLTNNHYTSSKLSLDEIELMNSDELFPIYQKRFDSASDFTFIFTGNIDTAVFKRLSRKYIAGIPSSNINENWRDTGLKFANGIINKEIKKGNGELGIIALTFSGDFNLMPDNQIKLKLLSNLIKEELRMSIREDKSGTYRINTYSECHDKPYPHYRIDINFGCDPKRVNELLNSVFDTIKRIKSVGFNPVNIKAAKETMIRTGEVEFQQNQKWLEAIYDYVNKGWRLDSIIENNNLIQEITDQSLWNSFDEYLNLKNYIQVILLPESGN